MRSKFSSMKSLLSLSLLRPKCITITVELRLWLDADYVMNVSKVGWNNTIEMQYLDADFELWILSNEL